jgi:hypothetical protein
MVSKETIAVRIAIYLESSGKKIADVGLLVDDLFRVQNELWSNDSGFNNTSQALSIWCNRINIKRKVGRYVDKKVKEKADSRQEDVLKTCSIINLIFNGKSVSSRNSSISSFSAGF